MIDDALREELSALIDGALPEERAKELRRRIREDAELYREYAAIERAVLAVRALPRAGAPEGLRTRLDASLRPARAGGRLLRLATFAVAAVVLLGVGLAFYLRGERSPAHYEASGGKPGERERRAEEAPEGEARVGAKDEASDAETASAQARGELAQGAQLGRAKGEKRGAPTKKEQADLLAVVAQSRRIPAPDRKAYLRQLAALGTEKAREHLRAVGDESDAREGREILPGAAGGGTPVLATIVLEDREEANLVKKILGVAPAAPKGSAALLLVEQEAKDQVNTEVEGTEDDLRRLGRWLALLDLAPARAARPKVTVLGEPRKEAEEAEPKVRTAIVRLRFGKPPEPKPAESAPGK